MKAENKRLSLSSSCAGGLLPFSMPENVQQKQKTLKRSGCLKQKHQTHQHLSVSHTKHFHDKVQKRHIHFTRYCSCTRPAFIRHYHIPNLYLRRKPFLPSRQHLPSSHNPARITHTMTFSEKLTELVAGRGLAARDHQRRLERKYKQAAEDLKTITDVACEPPATIPAPRSRPESLLSLPERLPSQGTLHNRPPNRIKLQRTQSEIPASILNSIRRSPEGPPDISAIDLTDDQLKRTYSSDNLWNPSTQDMPPLPAMKGFGRYRRFAGADATWQRQTLERSLYDIKGPLLKHLADFDLAEMDPKVWRDYRAKSIGSGSESAASSQRSSICQVLRKVERPCTFDSGKDLDSAVASSGESGINGS